MFHLIRRAARDLAWLVQLYRTTLIKTLRRVECRRNKEHVLIFCAIEVQNPETQRHIHECGWCQTLVLDQVTPVDNDIRTLLADLGIPLDPGLTLPEQGQYMN